MNALTKCLPPAPELRPMPADFARVAPTLSHQQNLRRWQCGEPVLRRWYGEAGVKPKPFVPRLLPPQASTVPYRDDTHVGRAAHHLRRYFSNVYRADVLPKRERPLVPAGWYFVAGKGFVPGADVIALAERYGFAG